MEHSIAGLLLLTRLDAGLERAERCRIDLDELLARQLEHPGTDGHADLGLSLVGAAAAAMGYSLECELDAARRLHAILRRRLDAAPRPRHKTAEQRTFRLLVRVAHETAGNPGLPAPHGPQHRRPSDMPD